MKASVLVPGNTVQNNLIFFDRNVRHVDPVLRIFLEHRAVRPDDAKLIHRKEDLTRARSRNLLLTRHTVNDILPHKAKNPQGVARLSLDRDLTLPGKVTNPDDVGISLLGRLLPDQNLVVRGGLHGTVLQYVQKLSIGFIFQVRLIYGMLQIEIEIIFSAQIEQLLQLRF